MDSANQRQCSCRQSAWISETRVVDTCEPNQRRWGHFRHTNQDFIAWGNKSSAEKDHSRIGGKSRFIDSPAWAQRLYYRKFRREKGGKMLFPTFGVKRSIREVPLLFTKPDFSDSSNKPNWTELILATHTSAPKRQLGRLTVLKPSSSMKDSIMKMDLRWLRLRII